VIGHAHFRIGRSDARDQFGFIGLAGNDRPMSGFSDAQRLFSKNKRDAILLPHSAVTRDAVLIQDGPYVTAEAHLITRPPGSERPKPLAGNQSATSQGGYRQRQRHDQTLASDSGKAEHNHHISSTKTGLREQYIGGRGICSVPDSDS
jgi:hypothetical protein